MYLVILGLHDIAKNTHLVLSNNHSLTPITNICKGQFVIITKRDFQPI